MSILCFLGALGGMDSFGPLGPDFEGHNSPHPVNMYLCILAIDVATIFWDGCVRLGSPVLQCPWGPMVSKRVPSCF